MDLPLKEAEYKFGPKKSVSTFDSTVVEVETDNGIKGVGEVRMISYFNFIHINQNMTNEVQWVPRLFERREFFHVNKSCKIECCGKKMHQIIQNMILS